MSISALMSIHQDNQYLVTVLEQIYDLVDEIVMLDGPFQWLLDYYQELPLDHSSHLSRILFRGKPLLEHTKIKHHHRIWRNDFEKRAYGYKACASELVLVVDSDELFQLTATQIQAFRDSAFPIAKFEVFSLARTYARAEFPIEELEFAVHNPYQPHYYYRLFKRAAISAEEHLSYLQVIHPIKSEQVKPPDLGKIYPESMGTIYHLCVMRTGYDNQIKYLFYTAQLQVANGLRDEILVKGGWNSYTDMLKDITLEDYLTFIIRGGPDSLRAPAGRAITRFDRMPGHLADAVRFSDNVFAELGAHAIQPIKLIHDYTLRFYLPDRCPSGLVCQLALKGIPHVGISEYRYFYGRNNNNPPITLYQDSGDVEKITIPIPTLSDADNRDLFARILAIYPLMPEGKRLGELEYFEFMRT